MSLHVIEMDSLEEGGECPFCQTSLTFDETEIDYQGPVSWCPNCEIDFAQIIKMLDDRTMDEADIYEQVVKLAQQHYENTTYRTQTI
jgi:hypothetical protein